jgi:hypothetical protein
MLSYASEQAVLLVSFKTAAPAQEASRVHKMYYYSNWVDLLYIRRLMGMF